MLEEPLTEEISSWKDCQLCKLYLLCGWREGFWFCRRHLRKIDKVLENMAIEADGYEHHDGKMMRGIKNESSTTERIASMLPTLEREIKLDNFNCVRERMVDRANDICDGYDSEEMDELSGQGLRPNREFWEIDAPEVLQALYAALEDDEEEGDGNRVQQEAANETKAVQQEVEESKAVEETKA